MRQAYGRLGAALKNAYQAGEAQARLKERLAERERAVEASDAKATRLDAQLAKETALSEALRGEISSLYVHIEHQAARIREEETGREALAGALHESRRIIQSLHSSTSWRITAPLRFVVFHVRRAVGALQSAISRAARFAYRRAPLPRAVKWRIADAVMTMAAPLIRNTATYRMWRIARRFEQPDAPPPPPWLRARGKVIEVARSAKGRFQRGGAVCARSGGTAGAAAPGRDRSHFLR